MSDAASATLQPNSAIPADDPNRKLTVANSDSSKVRHVAVVGGTLKLTGVPVKAILRAFEAPR